MTELKRPEKLDNDYLESGYCFDGKEMDSFLSQIADELERVYYKASEKNNQDFLEIIKKLRGDGK